jgi:5-methylcytosine-specific restriction endonuclease McrA
MYPSPDAVPDALHAVVAALTNDDPATARTHMDAIAFHRQEATLRRAPSPQALAQIYDRDRYQCRYCSRKTVLIEVMRLLSDLFPEQFPYHRNWKTSETHQAYWSVSATHDHVVPLSRGGDPLDPSNIVTTCWACNARKSGLRLEDIGFTLREPNDQIWRGLADLYPALWKHCGRPTLTGGRKAWLTAAMVLYA